MLKSKFEIDKFIHDNQNTMFSRKSHLIWKKKLIVYLCIQNEYLNNERMLHVVLDSFSIINIDDIGNGICTDFLNWIENLVKTKYSNMPIRINSVINERFRDHLKNKRNYKKHAIYEHSLFLMFPM